MVCIIWFDHARVEPLFAEIDRDFGFKVNTDHLMLFGLCRVCQHQAQVEECANRQTI